MEKNVVVVGRITKRNGRVVESKVRGDVLSSFIPWGKAPK